MKCAGCGQEVVLHRGGHWAVEKVVEGHEHYSFCCRTEIEGRPPVLIKASYHYVEGEEQRHWVLQRP